MKKLFFSLLAGLFIGLTLAFALFNYTGSTMAHKNFGGVDEWIVREMDIDFVFYALLLIVGSVTLIFLSWTLIEKKKGVHDLEQFQKRHEENK